ncbi:MAG: hypothetical protein WDM96_17310 [Lacunisphaera sp.]
MLLDEGVTTVTTPGVSIRNRYIGGPNRIYDNTNDSYRWTGGFEGKVNDYFNWNVYVNYALAKQIAIGYNQVLDSALQRRNRLRPLRHLRLRSGSGRRGRCRHLRQLPSPTTRAASIAITRAVNGKIFDLPAGPLQYAAGAEYRKETLFARPT